MPPVRRPGPALISPVRQPAPALSLGRAVGGPSAQEAPAAPRTRAPVASGAGAVPERLRQAAAARAAPGWPGSLGSPPAAASGPPSPGPTGCSPTPRCLPPAPAPAAGWKGSPPRCLPAPPAASGWPPGAGGRPGASRSGAADAAWFRCSEWTVPPCPGMEPAPGRCNSGWSGARSRSAPRGRRGCSRAWHHCASRQSCCQ